MPPGQDLGRPLEVPHQPAVPTNPDFHGILRHVLSWECDAGLATGDHVRVAAAAGELATLRTGTRADVNATAAYPAAVFLARCVVLAETDGRQAPGERAGLAGQYADRATALLAQAVASGHTDAGRIARDERLAPLRSRPAYQRLLAELRGEGKAREVAPPPRPAGR